MESKKLDFDVLIEHIKDRLLREEGIYATEEEIGLILGFEMDFLMENGYVTLIEEEECGCEECTGDCE